MTVLMGENVRYSKLLMVKQSHYRPGLAQRVSRRLRLPDFKTVDT